MQNELHRASRVVIPTLYLYELSFSGFYFIRDRGATEMMRILPFMNATASVVTVLYYSALGLLLYRKLGWKSLFPLIVMAGIQEGVYDAVNLLLTPSFFTTVLTFNPRWIEYDSFLAGASILSLYVQSRLSRPRYRISWVSLLFPLYVVYYALTLMYIITVAVPSYLNLFILTLFISYLKTVGYPSLRERTQAKESSCPLICPR